MSAFPYSSPAMYEEFHTFRYEEKQLEISKRKPRFVGFTHSRKRMWLGSIALIASSTLS